MDYITQGILFGNSEVFREDYIYTLISWTIKIIINLIFNPNYELNYLKLEHKNN